RRLPGVEIDVNGTYNFNRQSFTILAGQLGTYPGTGPIPGRSIDLPSADDLTGVFTAKATQPLSQQWKIGLGGAQGQVGRNLAEEQLRAHRQQIANDVKQTYYRIVELTSALAAAEEALGYLRELDGLVDRYVRERTALKSDALDVKARLAKAE